MTDRPRIDDANKLKDFDKVWNGLPMHFFRRTWFLPFIVALGNIVMDGHSLRDTYNQVDPGANGGGTAAQNQHTQTRNRRIFAILVNYIAPLAAIRYYLLAEYADNGIAALAYIDQDDVGNIPLSESTINEMEEEWMAMNMDNSNITISPTCILEWGNIIQYKGDHFPVPKTNLQMYNKFLNGLPAQLQNKVMDEREAPNANFNIGPNYVVPHPQAGNPHPQAGQKDMLKVISYFNRIWMNMVTRKLVRMPNANSADIDANYAGGRGKGKGKGNGKGKGKGKGSGGGKGLGDKTPKREMNEKVCCYKCGGLGHVAKIQCSDGTYLYCATTTQIPSEILNGIQYPHIPSAPERRAAAGSRANEAQAEEEPPEEEEDDAEVNAQFAAANLDDDESEAPDPFAEY